MKKAFTLAEFLIVIGIVGVISAITIPTIITKYRQMKVVTTLKTAISKWNKIYKISFEEVGEPSYEELKTSTPTEIWNKYYAPYVSTVTKSKKGYDNPPFYYSKGTKAPHYFKSSSNFGFYTNDGLFYFFQSRGGGNEPEDRTLVLDINGPEPPNTYGKDVFEFSFYDGEGIFPRCKDYTTEAINKECSKTNYGRCCAEKIRRDGWKISKDYPY
jgi:prepilin-type N-terminal cleavage/methylation domain-containing protein